MTPAVGSAGSRLEDPPEAKDTKIHCLYYMVELQFPPMAILSNERAVEILNGATQRLDRGGLNLLWNTVYKPVAGHFFLYLRNHIMRNPPQDGYFWTNPQEFKTAYRLSDGKELVVYKSRGGLDVEDPTLIFSKTRYQLFIGGIPSPLELLHYSIMGPVDFMNKNAVLSSAMSSPSVPEPKKPSNAYQIFVKGQWKKVREDYPNTPFEAIGKVMSGLWMDMPPEEKQMYQTMYEQGMQRYQKEKAEYLNYVESIEKAKEAALIAAGLSGQNPSDEIRSLMQQGVSGSIIPQHILVRQLPPTLEVYDEEEDDCSRKHLAGARYKRNHDMIGKLLDGLPVTKEPIAVPEGSRMSIEDIRVQLTETYKKFEEIERKFEERWSQTESESMKQCESDLEQAKACTSVEELKVLCAKYQKPSHLNPRFVPDTTMMSMGWEDAQVPSIIDTL